MPKCAVEAVPKTSSAPKPIMRQGVALELLKLIRPCASTPAVPSEQATDTARRILVAFMVVEVGYGLSRLPAATREKQHGKAYAYQRQSRRFRNIHDIKYS